MQRKPYFEQVYDVVRSIPVGRVTSYGAIADYLALGSARMVGWALRNMSQFETDVPAHRVVNRIGELSGRLQFSSPDDMQAMLEQEGVVVKNDKVVDFKKRFWHPEEG
jgi:methylated-DNA-protein-cysteine methyltransferase-like protein